MCQMCNGLLERYLVTGVDRIGPRLLNLHEFYTSTGFAWLVRTAVDEWTVAGRVDCGMLCRVKNVLRDVHVELEVLLSHNGSKNYGGAKLGV